MGVAASGIRDGTFDKNTGNIVEDRRRYCIKRGDVCHVASLARNSACVPDSGPICENT